MSTRAESDALETPGDLRDYLRPLRRYLLVILLAAVLAAALGYNLAPVPEPAFTARAQVLVGPGIESTQGGGGQDQINLVTEQNIVASTAVAEPASMRFDTPATPTQLLGQVQVTAARDSEVLQIRFTDSEPERAQQGAQAFADAYLEYRGASLSATLGNRRGQLEGQLAELQNELGAANGLVAATERGTPAADAATAARDLIASEMAPVSDALFALNGLTAQPGTVIGPATLPSAPSSDAGQVRLLVAAGAALAGLLLGALVAYARHAADDRILDAESLRDRTGLPVLGILSYQRRRRRDSNAPVLLRAPQTGAGEEHRQLRAAFLWVTRARVKTVLVTSVAPGEGKTTVAANLAIALSRADKHVILVSADLWAPRAHELFGVGNDSGLAEALAAPNAAPDLAIPDGTDVMLLTSTRAADGTDILASDAVRTLLTELGRQADFVVVDTAPLLVADALTLAQVVDGVVLVAAAQTSRTAITHARTQLDSVGANVVGAVLNKFKPRRARQRGSYYASHYGARYPARPSLLRRIFTPPPPASAPAATQEAGTPSPTGNGRASVGARAAPRGEDQASEAQASKAQASKAQASEAQASEVQAPSTGRRSG